jgi:hypothetical protein
MARDKNSDNIPHLVEAVTFYFGLMKLKCNNLRVSEISTQL